MIRCTKELKEEAVRAADRRRQLGEKYLTTLYKEFREGIPEREAYRLVLAEVRDTLLVTKVLIQFKLSISLRGEIYPPRTPAATVGRHDNGEACQFRERLLYQHIADSVSTLSLLSLIKGNRFVSLQAPRYKDTFR